IINLQYPCHQPGFVSNGVTVGLGSNRLRFSGAKVTFWHHTGKRLIQCGTRNYKTATDLRLDDKFLHIFLVVDWLMHV
ncbi:MAG TPA: hypothetical protein VIC08_15625, partial [Cellvibrionaceae bacterium]